MTKLGNCFKYRNVHSNAHVMFCVADAIDPLLDREPLDLRKLFNGSLDERSSNMKTLSVLLKSGLYKHEYLNRFD